MSWLLWPRRRISACLGTEPEPWIRSARPRLSPFGASSLPKPLESQDRVLLVRHTTPTTSTTGAGSRSEEHTSELQSRENLVCRLLLEKKNKLSTYCSIMLYC